MEKLFSSVLIVVLATTLLCGVGAAVGDENEYEQGRALYTQKCVLCHGVNGKGDGPAASAFSHTPANFTDPDCWRKNSDQKIENTIRKGKGDMPAFSLNEGELKSVVDYLSHAFKKG